MKFQQLYDVVKEDFDSSDESVENILSVLNNHSKEKIAFLDGPVIIKSTKYEQNPESFTFDKPIGFWYAQGGAWAEYMKRFEQERFEDYHYIASLNIDYLNVLKIDTPKKFQDFHDTYLVKRKFGPAIDWKRVANEYKGIQIIPYFSQFRRTHLWYNMWDLASGCIWDLSAIKGYKIIHK
jgi:hypothetical protein